MKQMEVKGNISFLHDCRCEGNVMIYVLQWNKEDVVEDSYIEFTWSIPMKDILYRWYPGVKADRRIPPNWHSTVKVTNSISYNAPMICFYNQKEQSNYTCALSEIEKITEMSFGVNEHTKELDCKISLPLMQYTGTNQTTFQIRIDEEQKPYEEAIAAVTKWWESFVSVMEVPAFAKDSFYSFWCSYHREITQEKVEAECEQVKAVGINAIIVDDGWQMHEEYDGFRSCGDWEAIAFPNMAEHVQKIHAMGLKYVLWYGVPFIGEKSKSFERFKDKFLYIDQGTGMLDPRYPDVRKYLVQTYQTALSKWNLDGFKLDFINNFKNPNNIPANEQMDICDLSDAVIKLMTEIKDVLSGMKKDILIEFRQPYIGPVMRSFGNFFRVMDCPNDFISNRIHTIDLRLLSGNTAIHSDMLMWHKDESVENAALQIINILFSSMQVSVKLAEQTEAHRKMIAFWVAFMREHRETLLMSKIRAHDPQNLYTLVEGVEADKKISAAYTPGKCVNADKEEVIIVNGTQEESLLVSFEGVYTGDVLNCMGDLLQKDISYKKGYARAEVPPSGLLVLKKLT